MSQFAQVSPRSGSDGDGEHSDARIDEDDDVIERLGPNSDIDELSNGSYDDEDMVIVDEDGMNSNEDMVPIDVIHGHDLDDDLDDEQRAIARSQNVDIDMEINGGLSPLKMDDYVETKQDKIFNNIPVGPQHFIGTKHEEVLDNIYEDITKDDMNPFIVLLGSEGIGKSCITTQLCNELYTENQQLFKHGIIYLDLMKWYKSYNLTTFEDCLINGIQECGLNTYWIQKYDDFLDITPSNIYSKLEQYLSNSLIIFEDFDRFKEINHISLEDCNKFLFNLFENISLKTKIIVTSRKKLPIYYNFNLFRTRFYELESFTKNDTIDYLTTYCPSFNEQDIMPYLSDIRDLTSYKPVFIYSLYKLWQNIRMFESTFDAIITLYKQLDKPQLLISHNIYNDKQDIDKILPFPNIMYHPHNQQIQSPITTNNNQSSNSKPSSFKKPAPIKNPAKYPSTIIKKQPPIVVTCSPSEYEEIDE